jgi:hypothetical protein
MAELGCQWSATLAAGVTKFGPTLHEAADKANATSRMGTARAKDVTVLPGRGPASRPHRHDGFTKAMSLWSGAIPDSLAESFLHREQRVSPARLLVKVALTFERKRDACARLGDRLQRGITNG